MIEIYALHDPRDGVVRYIGKAKDAQKRLRSHLAEKRREYPVYLWIRELASLGLRPSLAVLVQCNDGSWKEHEREHIARERKTNPQLLNLAAGGDQPECPTSVRAANGRRNAAARVSTPRKAKIWALKRWAGSYLKSGKATDKLKAAMRYAAQKRPELFGEWAGV